MKQSAASNGDDQLMDSNFEYTDCAVGDVDLPG